MGVVGMHATLCTFSCLYI